jgi:predicted metal-binding transcription factor (methanogenesis marker protein 9)
MDLLLLGQIDSQLKERSKTTVRFIAKLVLREILEKKVGCPLGALKWSCNLTKLLGLLVEVTKDVNKRQIEVLDVKRQVSAYILTMSWDEALAIMSLKIVSWPQLFGGYAQNRKGVHGRLKDTREE